MAAAAAAAGGAGAARRMPVHSTDGAATSDEQRDVGGLARCTDCLQSQ